MKNIIFLIFISISSHALVTCDYNSAVDKLNTSTLATGQCKELSIPVDVLYDSSCGDNLLAKYYGPLYTNYCTDSTLVQHTKYNIQIYSVQHNYTGCLSGQEIINGACAVPPTCASGTAWDSLTDICKPIPPPDADSDGTPDKCDYDFVNYKTLDCDGDGIANGTDDDIDGDGTPNSYDADSNNDGKQDSSDSSSPTYNKECSGADTSGDLFPTGVTYPLSYYTIKSAMLASSCVALVDNLLIDSSFSAPDKNPNCTTRYCYVHTIKDECHYWASDFIPDGKNWIISSIRTESACAAAVDNVKYIDHHWAFPNPTQCSMDKWCYLETKVATTLPPDDGEESNPNPDANSTSSDLSPLLQSMNNANDKLTITNEKLTTVNEKLDGVNEKLDTSNDHLSDLKNSSRDSKTLLDKIAENSLNSNANESELLNKLGKIGTTLTDSKNTISTMSDVVTSNQVIANQHLINNGGKIDTTNGLLTILNDKIDGVPADTSVFSGFDDLLSDETAFINGVKSQFTTFSNNINSNFSDIETQFTNAKSLFSGSPSSPSFNGSYSPSCFSFSVFGKHVVLDMSFLGVISPVIYFIFTLTFMVLNFQLLLNSLLRSNE